MERSLLIRHTGEIYAGLTFFYDQNNSGQLLIEKKSVRIVQVNGGSFREVFNDWSRFEPFNHRIINDLGDLAAVDQQIFFDTFRADINNQGWNDRDFGFDYLHNIIQTKVLFDQYNNVVGNLKIDSIHNDLTKTFTFTPIPNYLNKLACLSHEPFITTNKEILTDFMNGEVQQLCPNSFIY
jgi:hypothetical protein